MAEREEIIRIGSHDVKITRPEKLIFPADRISKRELIDYYRHIAPRILPHLRGRPLTMERYPDGIEDARIIQQRAASYYPSWIKTITVKKAGGTVRHVVCEDEAMLAYLANQACITPHTWLSRAGRLDYPDQMVFDLDPSGDSFAPVITTAKALRIFLEELGLPAYVKSTGSRGLHVIVPLKREEDFDFVRAFARKIAELVVNQDPAERTLEQRKNKRQGRVFLDTNRNAYGQTIAAAYAVRARPTAPVAVPLDWHELDKKNIRPDGVSLRNIFSRLDKIVDPWTDLFRHAVSLNAAQQKLEVTHGARTLSKKEAA